jgi:hypothetical protein
VIDCYQSVARRSSAPDALTDTRSRETNRNFPLTRCSRLSRRIVLVAMNGFDLKMDRIHNDITSLMVSGAYDGQNAKAIQNFAGYR